MSQSDIEKTALYLNLAYAKIRKASGSLKFVTGTDTPRISVNGGGENQETQIMQVGSAVWIANNDDGITTTMQDFCAKLEIKSTRQLFDHVEDYARRALDYNRVTHKAELGSGAAMHSKVLANLVATEEGVRADTIETCDALDTATLSPRNGAGLSKYTLGSGRPGTSGIVFVHGTYDATNTADNQHAEQKLLAALGDLDAACTSSVYVAGCKAPCSVCLGVLAKVVLKRPRVRYMNTQMADVRSAAGLGPYTATGIRVLDVDKYFP